MHLVELDIGSIPFGHPLPFALRGVGGMLLAHRGFIIHSKEDLQALLSRGQVLYVDTDESGESYRSYLAQLESMIQADKPLGKIAKMAFQVNIAPPPEDLVDNHPNWEDWQWRWTQLLHTPDPSTFTPRFERLLTALLNYSQKNPDAALLALIHLSAQELRYYSATHSMLVTVICTLVARETLLWPADHIRTLGRAAMGMNLGMTALQDQLAVQGSPLTAEQAKAIDQHSDRSVEIGKQLGISDSTWAQAVQYHHYRDPGPLAEKPLGRQMARLIQRADIFGAQIAPRADRPALSVTSAMQTCYYDETKAVDETGAALVKTLGIYPPGTWVRLASQEVGIVTRRSNHAATPRVSVFLNAQGMPCDPSSRDTSFARHKITATVAPKDLRVRISVDRLLALL